MTALYRGVRRSQLPDQPQNVGVFETGADAVPLGEGCGERVPCRPGDPPWASRPARTWARVAVALTALSLVPPFLVGANLATECALVLAHLSAAAIVIPVIARRLVA